VGEARAIVPPQAATLRQGSPIGSGNWIARLSLRGQAARRRREALDQPTPGDRLPVSNATTSESEPHVVALGVYSQRRAVAAPAPSPDNARFGRLALPSARLSASIKGSAGGSGCEPDGTLSTAGWLDDCSLRRSGMPLVCGRSGNFRCQYLDSLRDRLRNVFE